MFLKIIVIGIAMLLVLTCSGILKASPAVSGTGVFLAVSAVLMHHFEKRKFRAGHEEIKIEKQNMEQNTRIQLEKVEKTKKELQSSSSRAFLMIREIMQAQSEENAYNAVVNLLTKCMGITSFTVFEIDSDKTLRVKFSYARDKSQKPPVMVRTGDNNILGYVAQHGVVSSTLGMEKDRSLAGLYGKLPLPTLVCVPVKKSNQVTGLINIESFEGEYSRNEITMIETASFFLGVSLELLSLGYRF